MFPVNLIHEKSRKLGLEYLVIGGHAVNSYCEPRATLDVDFLVRKDDGPRWKQLLLEEGFKVMNDGGNFLQFSPPYGVPFRVDLMLVNEEAYIKMRRDARGAPCFGVQTLVPSELHLIALKVHAIRNGPEDRKDGDWRDVKNLVRIAKLQPSDPELRNIFDRHGTPEMYADFLKRV